MTSNGLHRVDRKKGGSLTHPLGVMVARLTRGLRLLGLLGLATHVATVTCEEKKAGTNIMPTTT